MKFSARTLFAKIESSYGVDPTPAGTNAIVTSGLTMSAYAGERVSRNLDKLYLGADTSINVNPHVQITQFTVELAPSGTAGTAPGWGVLLRACGLEETVSASTSVTYAPRSSGFESIYCYADYGSLESGDVERHKTGGVRGNCELQFTAGQLPLIAFSNLTGSYVSPAAVTAITPDTSAWQVPTAVTYSNTPTITLDGTIDLCLQSLTCNMGNTVVRRNRPGCQSTEITQRSVSGRLLFKKPDIDVSDIYSYIESHAGITTAEIEIVHGTTSGSIATLTLPTCQLMNPADEDVDGVTFLGVDYVSVPSTSGDDEFALVLT